MRCIFDSYTNVGGRDNNEDAMLTVRRRGEYLLAVADGLGGHDCGEVASALAVSTIEKMFRAKGGFDAAAAMQAANEAIFDEQKKTGKKMRTTLSLVYVQKDKIITAHVGDTRAYLIRDGKIFTRTVDHSVSQLAVRAGEITEDQIRQHPDRNVLTKVLGGYENLKPEINVIIPGKNDAVLICSDGFWEYVLEADMLKTLSRSWSPTGWLMKMMRIRRKNAPKGCDNNTAVAAFLKN